MRINGDRIYIFWVNCLHNELEYELIWLLEMARVADLQFCKHSFFLLKMISCYSYSCLLKSACHFSLV